MNLHFRFLFDVFESWLKQGWENFPCCSCMISPTISGMLFGDVLSRNTCTYWKSRSGGKHERNDSCDELSMHNCPCMLHTLLTNRNTVNFKSLASSKRIPKFSLGKQKENVKLQNSDRISDEALSPKHSNPAHLVKCLWLRTASTRVIALKQEHDNCSWQLEHVGFALRLVGTLSAIHSVWETATVMH